MQKEDSPGRLSTAHPTASSRGLTRWGLLALVSLPALLIATVARYVDPVDRTLRGTGTGWYRQQRELSFWIFVIAFAWPVVALVAIRVWRGRKGKRFGRRRDSTKLSG